MRIGLFGQAPPAARRPGRPAGEQQREGAASEGGAAGGEGR
jgi:hypothetical protein